MLFLTSTLVVANTLAVLCRLHIFFDCIVVGAMVVLTGEGVIGDTVVGVGVLT